MCTSDASVNQCLSESSREQVQNIEKPPGLFGLAAPSLASACLKYVRDTYIIRIWDRRLSTISPKGGAGKLCQRREKLASPFTLTIRSSRHSRRSRRERALDIRRLLTRRSRGTYAPLKSPLQPNKGGRL